MQGSTASVSVLETSPVCMQICEQGWCHIRKDGVNKNRFIYVNGQLSKWMKSYSMINTSKSANNYPRSNLNHLKALFGCLRTRNVTVIHKKANF